MAAAVLIQVPSLPVFQAGGNLKAEFAGTLEIDLGGFVTAVGRAYGGSGPGKSRFVRARRGKATASLQVLAVDFQLHLETESVEQCHPAKPVCAAPDDPIRVVLRQLQQARTGAAMICVDGKLQGIFTERDALKLLASGGSLDAPVAGVMIKNPVTLRANDTVGHAIALMSAGGFRRLPIVESDGHIRGVLKVSNILRYLVEHFPKVVYTLPPEPHYKPSQREGA